MYIWSALGEPTVSEGYHPPISSAERNVTENDAQDIFTVLAGPSRWQPYLKFNLDRHVKDLHPLVGGGRAGGGHGVPSGRGLGRPQ